MDFHVRSEDGELEKLAENATHLDDIDLMLSPSDGALVAVAQKNIDGTLRAVCWQCGGLFVKHKPKLQGVEVRWGGTRIMLHSQCETGKPGISIYFNHLKGLMYRRKLAKVHRASKGIEDAAAVASKKIIS